MISLWLDNEFNFNKFESLDNNLSCDVCIIGAGIFGITCGYYLSKKGFNVCIIDKGDICHHATGFTTAKITSQHNLIYDYLYNSYGVKFAKDYLSANQNAIDNIKNIVDDENILCDFEKQNSYVYTTIDTEVDKIKKEVSVVNSLGLDAEFVTKTGLPFDVLGAICFKNQAQFNPLKYIDGLCNCIVNNGGKIYSHTTASDVEVSNNDCKVFTNKGDISCKYIIVATHYPFINFPGFYFSKMYQSTSYVLAIDTKKSLHNGMYINTKQPIFSFRTAKYKGKKLLLLGGADHKTGNYVDYSMSYGVLENKAKELYPNCDIVFRWNTRDCITLDKIPYVGYYSNIWNNVFVGTGFNKWGMTSSNVAANIVTSIICNTNYPYSYIFNSTRLNPVKNGVELKNIVSQSFKSLVLNKIKSSDYNFDSIAKNSGSIIEINGSKVGIYKDNDNNLFAVNPVCTHLGCLLSWNDVDKTWDCPCHGSRFDFNGKNIYDPAFKNLEIYKFN